MEAQASVVSDQLIKSLSFKLRPGASYVTDRKSVTFFPTGSDVYRPQGQKVLKISLNDFGWLDPSTIKFMFKLTNTKEKTTTTAAETYLIKPLAGPYGFWRRIRLLVNGVCVEDIDYYNRLHHQFDILKPENTRINDQIEYGLGTFAQDNDIAQETLNSSNYDWLGGLIPCAKDQPNNNLRWCSFYPMLGLFQQDKCLPLFLWGP